MQKSLLISEVDREDYWVSGGISLPIPEFFTTYKQAVDFHKETLSQEKVIKKIVEDWCLVDDIFDGDENWKLISIEYDNYCCEFTFETSNEERHTVQRSCDFIKSI